MAAFLSGHRPPQESIGARLRRLATTARAANPRTRGLASTPPTITTQQGSNSPSGAGAANGRPYRWADAGPVFRAYGGRPKPFATTWRRFPVSTIGPAGGNTGEGTNATGWRVAFLTDAATPSVQTGPGTFRFMVDGQYVDLSGSVTTSGTGNHWFHLAFGSRKWREIVVEGELDQAFIGLNVGPTESARPVTAESARLVVLGDSFVTGTGAARPNDGFARVLGDHLGIRDVFMSGIGAQGWVAPGSSSYGIRQRLPYDVAGQAADAIVLALGINDSAAPAAVTAEVGATLPIVRGYAPGVPVFVFGVWPGSTGPGSTHIATETAIFAAVDALADPLIVKVPVCTEPTGSPVFGTGKVSAPAGTGNSDVYTGGLDGTDGTHPTAAGHAHLGLWAADQIMAKLTSWPALG